MAPDLQPGSRLGGALWTWFATIGGAVAWALHLFVVWGVTETTCLAGRTEIAGIALSRFVLAGTAVPLLVCLASAAAAWWIWRRTDPRRSNGRDSARVHLMAGVGLAANILFAAIVIFDGIALVVMPVCQA